MAGDTVSPQLTWQETPLVGSLSRRRRRRSVAYLAADDVDAVSPQLTWQETM